MYSFDPTEEQQMLIDAIKRYAANDLRAKMRDVEEEAVLPDKLIQKGWELGLLAGFDPGAVRRIWRALCGHRCACSRRDGIWRSGRRAGGDDPWAVCPADCPGGSEAQRQTYLPEIVEGPWVPYTAALIEPAFDFDPNDLRTTALQEGRRIYLQRREDLCPLC